MSLKPKKIEFSVGETSFKQEVVMEITYANNKEEISITKNAVSQRDDTERIFGLSRENIIKMAEILNSYK